MSKVWPPDVIRELLALANAKGEARATLGSPREAELFRFAIYSFRRQHNTGYNMLITLDDKDVIITQRDTPTVVIVHEQQEEMQP